MMKNNKLSESYRGGVFPDEETFQKIYEECLENDEGGASEAVGNSYQKMKASFDDYLSKYHEDAFRYAYQCGYEAAMKQIAGHLPKGGVTV